MSSETEKNDLISQFMGVTGADADRAKFYLESSAWKLDVSIESFFSQGDEEEDAVPMAATNEPAAVDPPQGNIAAAAQPKKQSRFATLSSVHSDSASDSEEGEAYYAGGSEHGGGQQIIDPRKRKKNAEDLVKDMFKAAKEHGAEEVSADAGPSTRPSTQRFSGSAYRLGETEDKSLMVPGFSAASKPKQVDMVLKLWKEGFSVDDGPLRDYKDPDNKDFLDTIKKGEVPRELISQARGGEVSLSMEDHRTEDYVKPKVKVKAFSGGGQRLGSPAVEPTATSAPAAAASSPAPVSVTIDTALPTTSLQIRLADGTRLVQKFNHSHSVADVRQFIVSQRPQSATTNFILMTTFPNKELTDEAQTLEAAKLLNAVLVQRLK